MCCWMEVIKLILSQNNLRLRLGLLKPKPTTYNLRMADETTTKPIGLIRDLKIYVHGIIYITSFTIL